MNRNELSSILRNCNATSRNRIAELNGMIIDIYKSSVLDMRVLDGFELCEVIGIAYTQLLSLLSNENYKLTTFSISQEEIIKGLWTACCAKNMSMRVNDSFQSWSDKSDVYGYERTAPYTSPMFNSRLQPKQPQQPRRPQERPRYSQEDVELTNKLMQHIQSNPHLAEMLAKKIR